MRKSPAHCPIYRTIGNNEVCRMFATITMRVSFARPRTCSKLFEGSNSMRMYKEMPHVVVQRPVRPTLRRPIGQ
eukprot:scaffold391_cov412-Pavlova_lutheri.AAC.6